MESLEKRRGAKALHAESTRQLEQEKLEFEMRKWKFESSLATRRADLHEMKESRRFALEQKRVLKEMQLDISRESRRVMLRARRMQQDEKKLETERILACASLMRNLNEAGFDKKEMLDMVLQ